MERQNNEQLDALSEQARSLRIIRSHGAPGGNVEEFDHGNRCRGQRPERFPREYGR